MHGTHFDCRIPVETPRVLPSAAHVLGTWESLAKHRVPALTLVVVLRRASALDCWPVMRLTMLVVQWGSHGLCIYNVAAEHCSFKVEASHDDHPPPFPRRKLRQGASCSGLGPAGRPSLPQHLPGSPSSMPRVDTAGVQLHAFPSHRPPRPRATFTCPQCAVALASGSLWEVRCLLTRFTTWAGVRRVETCCIESYPHPVFSSPSSPAYP